MDVLFEQAVISKGADYLAAEQGLRTQPGAAEPVLRRNLANPDGMARMLAEVLLAWTGNMAREYQQTLDYLDYLPARLARTPISSPSPTGIAGYLNKHFDGRVAEFLALRLLKSPDWPRWRVLGVLFYLKDQKLPSTTAALIRYAAETANQEFAASAVEAIRSIPDPDLRKKIAAERRRAEQRGERLTQALIDLEIEVK